MRSVGRRRRQRTETSAGRSGRPPVRGRSEDHPPRSSSGILTLRVVGVSVMPSILARAGADGTSLARQLHASPHRIWVIAASTQNFSGGILFMDIALLV